MKAAVTQFPFREIIPPLYPRTTRDSWTMLGTTYAYERHPRARRRRPRVCFNWYTGSGKSWPKFRINFMPQRYTKSNHSRIFSDKARQNRAFDKYLPIYRRTNLTTENRGGYIFQSCCLILSDSPFRDLRSIRFIGDTLPSDLSQSQLLMSFFWSFRLPYCFYYYV